jgi:23S rRNA pseudouridine1911/1915/1917 synthase
MSVRENQNDRPAVTPLRQRLGTRFPETSGRRLKLWILGGRVRVNGVVVRRGDVPVGPDDRVELGRAEVAFPAPLQLVHQDEDLLVIDKPPGLLSIATERERTRTAYRLVQDWVGAQRDGRIFVVHRLDRETSGLLVFARSPAAKLALQSQFEARTAERVYVARVEGVVRADRGELSGRLIENRALRVRVMRGGGGARGKSHGKLAVTRYRVIARYRDATLLELTLVTGRRGQIRAQLADLGHPIVGDRAYGGDRDARGRICLHATRLAFDHPSGRRVSFESPAPAIFRRA